MAQRRVAVFVDVENLCRVGEREAQFRALDQLCRGRGTAAVRRAYADWSDPAHARHQRALALQGVDLVQVVRVGAAQKNAVDVRLAVDAMETLIRHPDIDEYVLVAGDGDYSPLAQRLQEYGKTVVGVGTRASASQRLVQVCTEYAYWEDLVPSAQPGAEREREPEQAAPDVRHAVALLVRALAHLEDIAGSSADAGWRHASAVKNAMLLLDPSFKQSDYGTAKFGDFLELGPVRSAAEARRVALRVDVRRRVAHPRRHTAATG